MNEEIIIKDLIEKIKKEDDIMKQYDLIMSYKQFLETIKLRLDVEER